MVTLAYPQNGSFRCLSQLIYGRSMTSFGTWLFNWLLLLSTSSSFASSLPSGLPSQHRSIHRQPDLSPRTLDAGNHGFRRQASNNDGERWSDSAADELSQLSLVGSSLFAATALSPRRTQNYSDNNSKAKRFKLYLTIGCIPQNILIVDSTFRKSFSKAKRGAPAYLRAHVCASSFTSVHAAWSQLISFFLSRELLSYSCQLSRLACFSIGLLSTMICLPLWLLTFWWLTRFWLEFRAPSLHRLKQSAFHMGDIES